MAADHVYTKVDKVGKIVNNMENSINNIMENDMNINEETSNFEIPTSCKDGDELLIDLVKSYPHLWNKEDKDYKNLTICDTSWEEIANIMHLPGKYFFIKEYCCIREVKKFIFVTCQK